MSPASTLLLRHRTRNRCRRSLSLFKSLCLRKHAKQTPSQAAQKAVSARVAVEDEKRDEEVDDVGDEEIAMASTTLYRPLNPITEEIRLITLLPGKSPTPIFCLLTTMSLKSEETHYEALPYEWGDLKGQKSAIQRNLWFVLRGSEVSGRGADLDRCYLLISRLIPTKPPRKLEVLTSIF